MENLKNAGYMRGILFIGIPLASLIITPQFSLDPINVPKAFVLQAVGVFALSYLLINLKTLLHPRFRLITIIGAVFVLFLFSTLVFSGAPKLQQIFGTNGRNTGLFSYLALIFVLLTAMTISDARNVKIFAFAIFLVGGLNIIYGLMQTSGGDQTEIVAYHGCLTRHREG